MRPRTAVADLPERLGQRVTVAGWVGAIRDQKRMQFAIIRDHTGVAQAVHDRSSDANLAATISSLMPETAVWLTGTVVENAGVKLGGLEIQVEAVEVAGKVIDQIPITAESALDARMDHRFLDLRRPKVRLIFEIQTAMERAMRDYWVKEGFLEIHSPKLMGSPSESGAELFSLPYFSGTAYLAQSPQFYKQMAIAGGFDRVFEIGPVFRANPSFTSRHDTEFTSVDMEIGWVESHLDVMEVEEHWLQYVLAAIADEFGDRIQETYDVPVAVPTLPFPRVTMAEAYKILERQGYQVGRGEKGDLDPEGERRLAKHVVEEYGHEFVFVTDYPVAVRPFYHMRSQDGQTTNSFDLLFRGLEVTTGAQREHRYDQLVAQAQEKGLSLGPISDYLECFKFGCPPHGGLGFGLTRMLMLLTGHSNVREATFLYRGPNRLRP